jgi:hypothetical protein
MKRFYKNPAYRSLALAAFMAFGGTVSILPADAAPPTVTPSPGYDARLQEQRTAPAVVEPVREPRPVSRRRVKRTHDGAH